MIAGDVGGWVTWWWLLAWRGKNASGLFRRSSAAGAFVGAVPSVSSSGGMRWIGWLGLGLGAVGGGVCAGEGQGVDILAGTCGEKVSSSWMKCGGGAVLRCGVGTGGVRSFVTLGRAVVSVESFVCRVLVIFVCLLFVDLTLGSPLVFNAAVWPKISASCCRAWICLGWSGLGSWVTGWCRAVVSSFAAWRIVSDGVRLGRLPSLGRNCTVLEMRSLRKEGR